MELVDLCRDVRKDILTMIYNAGSGHPGGSLSAVEILAVLFFEEMNIDPKNPYDDNRDRFVLSKGHATAVYYSILSRRGFFSLEELNNYRKIGSRLQGHPDKSKFDLVETTSGSLGQGLSVASGIALALKFKGINSKVYCLLGDGELDEGQVWESLSTIKKYNLDNIIIMIDRNKIQLDGETENIKNLEPLKQKFESFNYQVLECNGNDIAEIRKVFASLKNNNNNKTTNPIIIFNTIKGKGVSFMENKTEWHGKAPNKEEYELAMREL